MTENPRLLRRGVVKQPKEDKDLDIVNMVFSAKKVLGSLKTILTITKI